ncbi:MAG: hypothetical protein ICV62_16650, partial [Cyanobacteria bacterium Co-bin13]|nr:hypothetical protein [Cyanobacteria bacterium Co-bin13]
MPLSLNPASLFSRTVRNRIGARTLGSNPMQAILQGGKQIVRHNIGGSFKGFLVGLVFSSIPTLTWSLSGLWELFTTATLELYYFDWNIPDDTLDQQAQAQWEAYGGILGGTAGSAIGFFACGVVPASSIMAFNEDLGRYVLREVGEEAFEEVTAQFSLALRMSIRNLARQTFGWLYKGARRWLKDPSNPVGNILFGGRANQVRETWGEANAPSWSFAQAVEEQVERIPSRFWQNFTEELIDEAIDSCIEAGYVLTGSIDTYWARQREAQIMLEPAQRVVEITPNRDNERETIVLAGPEPE